MKLLDLTGRKINKLTVIKRSNQSKSRVAWDCVCDCGNTTTVFGNNLIKSHTKSCGCDKKHEDIIGEQFGNFVVIAHVGNNKRQIKWECQCKICLTNKIFLACQLKSQFDKGFNLKCDFCYEKEKEEKRILEMKGKTFGNLTAISYEGFTCISQGRKTHKWLCECICGNQLIIAERSLCNKKSQNCTACATPSGPEHHSWNPDLTDEERFSRRKSSNFWSKEIYKKDNYTCQVSGETGCILNAHHLFSWHSHKELRFEISNGVTIKESLHRLFHSLYGKKFNTPEQFNDFKRRYDLGEFELT